jgi:hypothetical protein
LTRYVSQLQRAVHLLNLDLFIPQDLTPAKSAEQEKLQGLTIAANAVVVFNRWTITALC